MRTDFDPILGVPLSAPMADAPVRPGICLSAPTRGRQRTRKALEQAELRFVVRVVQDGGIGPWRALSGARFTTGLRSFTRQGRLSRGCTADLLVALADRPTRDRCWLHLESDPDPRWPAFWLHLSRRALPPFRAEPLFLLAWSAWRLRDGRLAAAAADAVIAEDRNHRAAVMLRAMLRGGLEPAQLPSLSSCSGISAGAL
jgi:hypothetical protein